jgi:hypothetical protein
LEFLVFVIVEKAVTHICSISPYKRHLVKKQELEAKEHIELVELVCGHFTFYSIDRLFYPITYFSLLIQLNKLRHPYSIDIAFDRYA